MHFPAYFEIICNGKMTAELQTFEQSERLPKSRVFNTHWRSKNSLFTTQISPANKNHAKVTVLLAYHFKLLEAISLGILHRLCCVYFFVSKKPLKVLFFSALQLAQCPTDIFLDMKDKVLTCNGYMHKFTTFEPKEKLA